MSSNFTHAFKFIKKLISKMRAAKHGCKAYLLDTFPGRQEELYSIQTTLLGKYSKSCSKFSIKTDKHCF